MDKPLFKLKVYEGPLDLLLDMIRSSKLDIFDIDIFEISEQYFLYIKTMGEMNMDLTADFLVMASQLLLIKSRMLLPKAEPDDDDDPRRDLTWALIEYEKCKQNAQTLASLREAAGETFPRPPEPLEFPKKYRETMKISALTGAYLRLMERSARRAMPRPDSFADFLKREIYSVSDKISEIKSRLKKAVRLDFAALFLGVRTRSEIVATFLAVLELVSDKKIRISDAGDMNYEIEAAERRF